MHPVYHRATELPSLYLVRSASGKQRVAELHSGHHQWLRDPARDLVHYNLYMVCIGKT